MADRCLVFLKIVPVIPCAVIDAFVYGDAFHHRSTESCPFDDIFSRDDILYRPRLATDMWCRADTRQLASVCFTLLLIFFGRVEA